MLITFWCGLKDLLSERTKLSLTVKNYDGSEGREVYDLQTIFWYVLAVYTKTTKKTPN